MRILGLAGRKGSGKDTVHRLITELRPGLRVARVAFADALKEEVAGVLGTTVADIEADKPRFRLMLQWWGTEWRRATCPTYWIDRAREKILAQQGKADLVVVTDVRFPNEAALIEEMGGTLVRVQRPSADAALDAHSSEVLMDSHPYQHFVSNYGSLDLLRHSVDLLLARDLGLQ